MDTVLIVLGVLGFGAIAISAYVFTVAARNYVNEGAKQTRPSSHRNLSENDFIKRSDINRRRDNVEQFPFALDGAVITSDRRSLTDRRAVSA